MFTLIFLFLQQSTALEFCQGQCDASSNLSDCMECLNKHQETFNNQSLCDLWNFKSCNLSQIDHLEFGKKLRITSETDLQSIIFEYSLTKASFTLKNLLFQSKELLDVPALFWFIGNYTKTSFDGFLYVYESPDINNLDLACLDTNKFFDKWETSIHELPERLKLEEVCYQKNNETIFENRQLQVTCPVDAWCSYCQSSSPYTWIGCNHCPAGLYAYNGLCWTNCPNGTLANSGSGVCEIQNQVAYELDFLYGSAYDTMGWNSPCAYDDENMVGYFFWKCQYNHLDNFVMPYFYVISGWIFLNSIKSSWTQILYWNSDLLHINNNYLELYQDVTDTASFRLSTWNYFYIARWTDWTNVNFALFLDGNTEVIASVPWTSYINFVDSPDTFYLGAPPLSTGLVGFTGYIYSLIIYTEYLSYHTTENYIADPNSCDQYYPCSTCPSDGYCLTTDHVCPNPNCDYCESGSNEQWFGCSSCIYPYYFYKGNCYGICPRGTSADSNNMVCTQTSSYAIELALSGTISSAPYGSTLENYNWPVVPVYPFAVLDRGYYFDNYASMKISFVMPVLFVITGWVNLISLTCASTPNRLSILAEMNPGGGLGRYMLHIENGYPKFYSNENTAIAFTPDTWFYMCAVVYTDEMYAYTKISLNRDTFAIATTPLYSFYVYTNAERVWFIGGNIVYPDSGYGHWEGFNGYLYNLYLRNEYSANYINTDYETSGCKGSCSVCPGTLTCPGLDCAYNQFITISGECGSCLSSACNQGCAREIDCNKCLDNCNTCNDFTSCTVCNTNYLLSPSGNSCLKECPTGSTDNGSSQCVFDSSSGHIYSLTFNHLQGTVPDNVRGINVMAGTTSAFYPDYASDSPIAVKDRGYYFDGNALMQFPLGVSVSYGSDFSLSTWIYCPTPQSGVLVSKQVLDPDVIMKFELNGSNTPQLTLFLTLGTGTTTTSPIVSNTAIDGTQWFNLAFSVAFTTPNSKITFYTNGVASPYQLTLGAFIDLVTDYSITIGAQRTMSGFINFFKGYIYSLSSWNVANNPSLIDMASCSCGICPSTSVGCLPNAGIDQFWNGNSWQSCHANCALTGCVRYDSTCNLCESQSCLICDDWTGCLLWCDPTCLTCNGPTSADCTLCADTSLVLDTASGSCICPETNQFISVKDPLTCAECYSSCATCVGPNYDDCVLCSDETFTVSQAHGFCECNSTQYLIARSPIECGECDTSCLTCSAPGKLACTSCPPGLTLNDDGSCSCGFGVLQDSECVQCDNPTCKACLSSSDNCVACHSPRVLEGNSCNCPQGMRELFGGCISSTLSINEQYSSNIVYLVFNEDLSEALRDQDLNITLLSEYQVATFFTVSQISLSYYQVSVSFNPVYSSLNGTLNIYITSQKYGASGSALQTRFFKHKVTSTNSDAQIAMDFVAAIVPRVTQTTVAASVLVYGGVSYIMLRKSTTLWTYVNMVQIIAFIPLQNIQIPSDLFNMLKGFISYGWLPNFGELVYGSTNAGNAPLSRFSHYGYTSGLFLVSAGGMITFILLVLALWNILWLAKILIRSPKVKTILETKVLVNFKWNWMLRLMVEIYILAFCGVVIGMNNINGTRPDFIIDFIISWIFFFLCLYLNFIIFWVIWKNKEKIVLKDEEFKKKYPVLVAEFHCEKGILSMCYYPWFLLRRTIFILALYNLADVPILQSAVNAVCSVITLVFLAKYKPYKDKYDNQVEMVTEFFIASLFVDVTPYVDDTLSVEGREACQLIAILGMLLFLLYSYALLAYRIILKIKNRKKNKEKEENEKGKEKEKLDLEDISPELAKMEELGSERRELLEPEDLVEEISPEINKEEELASEHFELIELSHTSKEVKGSVETYNRL